VDIEWVSLESIRIGSLRAFECRSAEKNDERAVYAKVDECHRLMVVTF